jgi:lipopolysaccharide transport system ATP-binding protein
VSELAVKVEGLGKRYRIGAARGSYQTLRDTLAEVASAPFRKIRDAVGGVERLPEESATAVWALRDVSFELERGKVLGVIGHNGAGKSTLLKIVSRITSPTTGRALLWGRVGSLLEVGTGFHGELTGRENTFLNGAILGMSRAEIRSKMDEIVAFAEVEKFLDTPVKFYSSGMYLRLAFAVAAHLDPEILVVDEVLAVGDAAFQKKCLGKMGQVAQEGRTVLFVSHNMGAVNTLCDRVLLLERGRVTDSGPTEQVTSSYLARQLTADGSGVGGPGVQFLPKVLEAGHRVGDAVRLTQVTLTNPDNPELGPRTGDPLVARFHYRSSEPTVSPTAWIRVRSLFGQEIFRLSTRPISGFDVEALHPEGVFELTIPRLPLTASRYLVDVGIAREMMGWMVRADGALEMQVVGADVYQSGIQMDHTRGLIVLDHSWSHEEGDGGDSR